MSCVVSSVVVDSRGGCCKVGGPRMLKVMLSFSTTKNVQLTVSNDRRINP